MLEQYFGMKGKHPEAVLLARVGDFYEAYGEDAETIARALQIALTSKEAGGGQRVAMAGVPHHALAQYLARLVAQRFVVALAEQLEAPQPNKLVRREVVRIVTPGTLIEDQLLDGKQNNYLASVASIDGTFALAYADVSTGYSAATAIGGENAYDEVLAELGRIGPAEVVVADLPAGVRATMATAIEQLGARLASVPLGLVETRRSRRDRRVPRHWTNRLAMHRALDALASFVKRTGIATSLRAVKAGEEPAERRAAPSARLPPPGILGTRSVHAQTSRADARARTESTCDAAGDAGPLRDVDGLASAGPLDRRTARRARTHRRASRRRSGLSRRARPARSGARNSQRVLRSGAHRAKGALSPRAAARSRIAATDASTSLGRMWVVTPPALASLVERIGDFGEMFADLQRCLVDEPPHAQLNDGGVIRPEAHPELAECVVLRTDARSKLSELEERERERTGIKSLKVKYASAFGYAIEIGKSFTGSVPADYVRKQTLTTGERYITPELKELELAISTAQGRQERLELQLFDALLDRIAARTDDLLRAADALAEIDVLAALAQCAAERGYVRPSFVEESIVSIEEGRHPVMEAILHAHFVPNDLLLRAADHRFILLTGPNMGGKSTYLRQTGLLAIMAQIERPSPKIPVRPGKAHDAGRRRPDLHAHRRRRRSGVGTIHLLYGDGRGGEHPAPQHASLAAADRRSGPGDRNAGRLVDRPSDVRVLARARRAGTDGAVCHALSRAVLAGRPLGSRRELSHDRRRKYRARWCTRLLAPRSAAWGVRRAPSASKSRAWRGPFLEAVVARAQEIADALSGHSDVEAQVPLRRRMSKPAPAELQLSFSRDG